MHFLTFQTWSFSFPIFHYFCILRVHFFLSNCFSPFFYQIASDHVWTLHHPLSLLLSGLKVHTKLRCVVWLWYNKQYHFSLVFWPVGVTISNLRNVLNWDFYVTSLVDFMDSICRVGESSKITSRSCFDVSYDGKENSVKLTLPYQPKHGKLVKLPNYETPIDSFKVSWDCNGRFCSDYWIVKIRILR